MKAREYSGPLGILAAGALGLSLLCGVSAMAMGDLNRYIPITIEPLNIVDLAVSNLETAAAFTEQVVTVFVPTATVTPSGTPSLTPNSPQPTDTQRRFVTITPTVTRKPRIPPTATMIPPSRTPDAPTRTNTPIPPTTTNTPITPTRTPTPFDTPTPNDTPTPVDTPTQIDTVPPNDTATPIDTPAEPAPTSTGQSGAGSDITETPSAP